MRVAAGAIARKVIKNKIKKEFKIIGALVQVGEIKIDYDNWNEDFIGKNNFFSPDEKVIEKWEKLILKARYRRFGSSRRNFTLYSSKTF